MTSGDVVFNTLTWHPVQVRPLEMFFPFDPYLLRRSARFLNLATSYNTWGGSRQHDTDASHLSSDDELEVPEGLTPILIFASWCSNITLGQCWSRAAPLLFCYGTHLVSARKHLHGIQFVPADI